MSSLVVLLVVASLPGLVACGRSCTAFEYSIANGAQGAATSAEALSGWLRDAPPGFDTDPGAWSVRADQRTYSDGTGRITVEQAGGTTTGYFVTSAHTCDQ